jgi:uncharacterized membrane protein
VVLPDLPVAGELAQFRTPHSAYGATCWTVAGCACSYMRDSVIFARSTKLSLLFYDVSFTFAMFVIFAATRTGGRNREWSYNRHAVWASPEIWTSLLRGNKSGGLSFLHLLYSIWTILWS